MTPEQKLIDQIRNRIKENGFMSSIQIVMEFTQRSIDGVRPIDVMDQLANEDIRSVEYTNSSASGRVKDLFYYVGSRT